MQCSNGVRRYKLLDERKAYEKLMQSFGKEEANFEENPFISCQSSLSMKLVMDGNIFR